MIQSLERTFAILDLFRDDKELGLMEIANRMNLNKTTVYGLLETMESFGYIEKNTQTKKYSLGLTLMELGYLYSGRLELRTVALKFMQQLQKETGEAVQLACLRQGNVVYLERVLTPNFMRINTRRGNVLPAYCSAIGKALLSCMEEEQLEKYMEQLKFKRLTAHTIASKEELKDELTATRARGYSIDNCENEAGVQGIAMPVFNGQGKAIAAVSVGCMSEDVNQDYMARLIPRLKDTVAQISRSMGYREER